MIELWKKIPAHLFPGYEKVLVTGRCGEVECSNTGKFRALPFSFTVVRGGTTYTHVRRGKEIVPGTSGQGRPYIALGGRQYSAMAVIFASFSEIPRIETVYPIDGDWKNLSLTNITTKKPPRKHNGSTRRPFVGKLPSGRWAKFRTATEAAAASGLSVGTVRSRLSQGHREWIYLDAMTSEIIARIKNTGGLKTEPKVQVPANAPETWTNLVSMPGVTGYHISSYGQVRSPQGQLLAPRRSSIGGGHRLMVTIIRDDKTRTARSVHNLVAEHFLEGFQGFPRHNVFFRDNNPENCKVQNLYYL